MGIPGKETAHFDATRAATIRINSISVLGNRSLDPGKVRHHNSMYIPPSESAPQSVCNV